MMRFASSSQRHDCGGIIIQSNLFFNPFFKLKFCKTMKRINLYAALLGIASLTILSCSKEQAVSNDNIDSDVDIEQIRQEVENTLNETLKLQETPTLAERSRCNGRVVIVNANSHNALKEAIQRAGEGGIVYLRSGVHTETERITVSTPRINIIGERGAVLKLNTTLSLLNPATGITVNPAIHFYNAPRGLVQNIDFKSLNTDGGGVLLFENSNNSCVVNCQMTGFQFPIWVEKSDKMILFKNTIVNTSAWQTNGAAPANGIVIANGKQAYIAENNTSNCLFGIWCCDESGICERNYTHGNLIGIILCNVPTAFVMPSGRVTGSLVPGAFWKTRHNLSTDNQYGYLVIDGANNNLIENNDAARNAAYDMELTTDSYRFGFLTPKSYNNKVITGRYQHLRIKDCGENNTIIGGIKVNTATDPCN
jgi:hypothetical protein